MLHKIRERFGIAGLLTKVYRTKGGLYFPELEHVVDRRNNVLGLLRRADGSALLVPATNIITVDGNVYFAQRSAGTSPTNSFTTWELGSAGTPASGADRSDFTPIASTQQVQDGTYPTVSDADSDNTGSGASVRTSRVSYAAATFNHAAITHGWITNPTPGASEPLLAGWAWASSINKTASDTLKCFHNATALGV